MLGIRYIFTCGIDRTQSTPLTEHWKGRGCVAAGMAAESFPFRSSCGLLSRHFTPSRHLSPPSPHTTETGCLPSSLPPLSLSSRHSKWSRHFICLHGNWNCQLPPLSLSPLTAFDPFRGGDQRPSDGRRSPNCGYKVPALPPNHTPHHVS